MVRVFLCGLDRVARVVVPLGALFPGNYFQSAWMVCKPQSEATVQEGVP